MWWSILPLTQPGCYCSADTVWKESSPKCLIHYWGDFGTSTLPVIYSELRKSLYAVGWDCSWPIHTDTCKCICSSKFLHVQDSQTAHDTWSCIAAFHVYTGRPATQSNGNFNTASLGLKSKKETCTSPSCGPNFCCCIANQSTLKLIACLELFLRISCTHSSCIRYNCMHLSVF